MKRLVLGLGILKTGLAVFMTDLSLKGDNALAFRDLAGRLKSRKQAKIALAIGMAVSLCCDLGLAFFAIQWVQQPWITVIGALVLFWLVFRHFQEWWHQRRHGIAEVQNEEPPLNTAHPMWLQMSAVIGSIVLTGFAVSVDNLLAVLALTQNFWVILGGVLCSEVVVLTLLLASWDLLDRLLKRAVGLKHAIYILLGVLALFMLYGLVVNGWNFPPIPEDLKGFASPLILLGIPVGIRTIQRWNRKRRSR